MRIALVHRDLHAVTRGGIGTLYRALAPRLRAAGHEVTLITQRTPSPLELEEISVVPLPRTGDMERHRQAVAEALASLAPDIAESSSWEAETLHYARLPRAGRSPVVVRGDLSAVTMRAGLPLVAAERELVHAADAILAVSGFAAGDLTSAYAIPRPAVTANGADRDRFRGTAPELLAAGGGCTYRDSGDLRAILAGGPAPGGTLPAAIDWDATATATIGVYQALREGRKAA